MKIRMLFASLLMMIAAATGYAGELNSSQIAFRTSIVNYLRNEGFSPSIDNDGDIKFKKEGRTLYISIHDKESEFFNATVKMILDVDDPTSTQQAFRLYKAANAVNNGKYFVKCSVLDSDGDYFIVLGVEVLVTTAAEYRTVLDRYISVVCNSVSDFNDNY